MALALLLRAPWFDAALGRDEGGVAFVAQNWHGGGEFAYGSWFLDRPPLLVALYRLAGDTEVGIRVLGAVAASLLVVLSTALAVRVGGRRAAPWAAGISAVLASSFAIRSVYTPAELLAVVPSCASVLLLVVGLQTRRLWAFAGAGALAATALLVKQSFGDALVAGFVALAAAKLIGGVSWRESGRRVAAYGGGVAAVALALLVWAWSMHVSAHSLWYATFGFRLDAVSALSGSGFGGRISKLGSPFLDSGLAVAVVLAVVGVARLRAQPIVRVVLAAWVLAAVIGVLLGGSYWPHYLIALIPPAAAGAAWGLARHPRWVGVLAVCAIGVPTALNAFTVARHDSAGQEPSAVTIGHYLHARALPGQTAYVLYAKVNVVYYAGLRDPFPYNWSLMMRAVPGAQARLRHLLASGQRPTWVVKADSAHSFGLDRSGATKRLLSAHYRQAGTVCGFPILLARGAAAGPAPQVTACGPAGGSAAVPTSSGLG